MFFFFFLNTDTFSRQYGTVGSILDLESYSGLAIHFLCDHNIVISLFGLNFLICKMDDWAR